MADLVQIQYDGDFANAERVDVQFPGPFSHELGLPDGNVLKMDMSVHNFFRLVDKKDQFGEPIYVLNVQVKVTRIAKPQGDAGAQE